MSRFSFLESDCQQIPAQNLCKEPKEAPERLITTLPRWFLSVFLKASFTLCFAVSSVRAACCLALLKPAPLCAAMCPKHSAQTTIPPVCRDTNIFSLCVSQKTFHKSNRDGHWSGLQPEGQSHRVPAEFEHGNMQCTAVSGANHKSWWIGKLNL